MLLLGILAYIFVGLILMMTFAGCLDRAFRRHETIQVDTMMRSRPVSSTSGLGCLSEDDHTSIMKMNQRRSPTKKKRKPDRHGRCSSEPRTSLAENQPEYDLFSAPMVLRIRGNRHAISGVSMRFNSPCKF